MMMEDGLLTPEMLRGVGFIYRGRGDYELDIAVTAENKVSIGNLITTYTKHTISKSDLKGSVLKVKFSEVALLMDLFLVVNGRETASHCFLLPDEDADVIRVLMHTLGLALPFEVVPTGEDVSLKGNKLSVAGKLINVILPQADKLLRVGDGELHYSLGGQHHRWGLLDVVGTQA